MAISDVVIILFVFMVVCCLVCGRACTGCWLMFICIEPICNPLFEVARERCCPRPVSKPLTSEQRAAQSALAAERNRHLTPFATSPPPPVGADRPLLLHPDRPRTGSRSGFTSPLRLHCHNQLIHTLRFQWMPRPDSMQRRTSRLLRHHPLRIQPIKLRERVRSS